MRQQNADNESAQNNATRDRVELSVRYRRHAALVVFVGEEQRVDAEATRKHEQRVAEDDGEEKTDLHDECEKRRRKADENIPFKRFIVKRHIAKHTHLYTRIMKCLSTVAKIFKYLVAKEVLGDTLINLRQSRLELQSLWQIE